MDRIGAAARWLGVSTESLNYALEYAKNRVQFGRPISKFQPIREIFAEMHRETGRKDHLYGLLPDREF